MPRRVLIIGAGGIGSAFAFRLARAGYDVAVLARGARLAQLEADGGVVAANGTRAVVRVVRSLDAGDAYDLIIVAVLGWQVDALLPALAANASPVLFAFNTFGGLERLRDAVGAERFGWVFPAVIAELVDGRLRARFLPRVLAPLQVTTLGAMAGQVPAWVAPWVRHFSRAGIASVLHGDMLGWLSAHAAFMSALMVAGHRVRARRRALSWLEARIVGRGLRAGLEWVEALGRRLAPFNMVLLRYVPVGMVAFAVWLASRLPVLRALGGRGPEEARWLLTAMKDAGPAPPREVVELLALLENE